jgi:hypothetical protein
MTTILWLGGTILVVWVVAAIAGVGKNTVFRNPETMSDAQLERTIRLTQRIMDNSQVGSKSWSEAGDKFSAAYAEQRRRQGLPPLEWRQPKSE